MVLQFSMSPDLTLGGYLPIAPFPLLKVVKDMQTSAGKYTGGRYFVSNTRGARNVDVMTTKLDKMFDELGIPTDVRTIDYSASSRDIQEINSNMISWINKNKSI